MIIAIIFFIICIYVILIFNLFRKKNVAKHINIINIYIIILYKNYSGSVLSRFGTHYFLSLKKNIYIYYFVHYPYLPFEI